MSENGTTQKQEKNEIDRLERIITTKEQLVDVEGMSIRVIKWNLKQSMKLSVVLGQLVRSVIMKMPELDLKSDPAELVANILKADLSGIVDSQYDNLVLLISETVVRENFDGITAARKWTEELGVEGLEILSVIARQNIRPLVRVIGNVAADARKIAEARRASR